MVALVGLGTLRNDGDGSTRRYRHNWNNNGHVMVVAAITPRDAWHQPLLRLVDTVVGVGIGVACKWAASFLYFRIVGEPVR